MLERLRKHKLYLRHNKCEFEWTSIEYLGLIISDGEIRMDPVKVAGVTKWPTPTKKKEVQSFLGFANFYHQFIEGFSHHVKPLFDDDPSGILNLGKTFIHGFSGLINSLKDGDKHPIIIFNMFTVILLLVLIVLPWLSRCFFRKWTLYSK